MSAGTARAGLPVTVEDQGEDRGRYLLDREGLLGPLLLLPAIAYIAALVGFPLVLAIAYSFSDVIVADQSIDWVGLDNFRAVVKTPNFQNALRNTFLFTIVSQVIVLVMANALAMVLAADFRGKRLVRFLTLLPWTTPIALAVLGWLWLLDNVYSPVDWLLREAGLLGPGTWLGPMGNVYWLSEPSKAQLVVLFVHIWRTLPLATVILLAGLTAIPQDVRDAANVDGAGFWRQLVYIRIPLLLPIMAVAVLFGMVFTFTDMTVVYVLTRGNSDTHVLASLAYFTGVESGSLAQGAAIALFLFPALVGIAVLMLRLARRTETN